MVHQSEPSETVGDITLIPFPGIRDGVQVFLGGSNGVEAYRVFGDYNLRTYSRKTTKRHFLNLNAFRKNINRLGLWFERVLRQPISFWPLSQPRDLDNALGDGFSRFFWDCDCGMEMSFRIRDKHFRHNNQPTEAYMASLPTAAKGGMADTAKARPIHKRLDPTMPVRPLSSSIFVWLITAIMYTPWRYFYMSKAHRKTALSPEPLDVTLIRIGSVLCHYIHGINDIQESPGRIRMVILDCLNLLSLDICVQLRHPVDPERLGEDMRLFVVPFTMELHFLVFEVAYIFVGICLILASFYKVLWGLWDWVCPVVPGVAGAGGSDDEVDCGSPNIDMAAECSKRTAASAGHQTTKTESGGQESRKFRHARLRKKSGAAKGGNNSGSGSGAPSTNVAIADPVPKPPTISDNFQIFFCARGSAGDRDVVKVLKFSKSQNDRDLFSAFRKSYFAIRGWKLWFSLLISMIFNT
ncbi:hypothetical protein TWF225_000528 [Orbilia oligospora]|nr:hypothetical protein TWF225_000528 [Orbilia oligospora]KAF3264595.1 hypothetical protein TWF128_001058 [Orbilia oligospora]KAF3290402.1 hypothetical protein TWF132_006965 [Orbilia oligospora]